MYVCTVYIRICICTMYYGRLCTVAILLATTTTTTMTMTSIGISMKYIIIIS